MPPEVWTPLAASSSIGRDQTRKLRVRLRPTANPERPESDNNSSTARDNVAPPLLGASPKRSPSAIRSLILYNRIPPHQPAIVRAPSRKSLAILQILLQYPFQSSESWIRQRPHNLAHTPFFVFDVTLLQCYTRGSFTVDRFPPFYSGSSPFLNQVVQCATTRTFERKDFPTHNGRGLP